MAFCRRALSGLLPRLLPGFPFWWKGALQVICLSALLCTRLSIMITTSRKAAETHLSCIHIPKSRLLRGEERAWLSAVCASRAGVVLLCCVSCARGFSPRPAACNSCNIFPPLIKAQIGRKSVGRREICSFLGNMLKAFREDIEDNSFIFITDMHDFQYFILPKIQVIDRISNPLLTRWVRATHTDS